MSEKKSQQTSRGDAILHPQRLRIIRALASGPKTPAELALVLPDIAQASLYRHLSTLLKASVVTISAETPIRGVVERTYSLESGSAVLGPDELKSLSPDEHFRYFSTFVAGLLAQFGRYLDRPAIDPAADGMGYRELVLNLTDDEFAELVRSLQDLLRPLATNAPRADRKPRLLSTIFLPLDPSSTSTSTTTSTEKDHE